MTPKIFMVIPTWNNAQMCGEAIRTLYEYTDFADYGELLIVDNSPEPGTHVANLCAKYNARYRPQEENLGWMRSINAALHCYPAPEIPLFTMCNDDVVFPQDREFWPRTIKLFDNPEVAGVGPVSNYVMGAQFSRLQIPAQVIEVPFLIGFCATYRTQVLVEAGGLDADLPGGDDLDISIRIKAQGHKLLCDHRSFLFHYGSVTGNRVHTDWDSLQAQHKTLNALIRKHGFRTWLQCVNGPWSVYMPPIPSVLSDGMVNLIADEVCKLGEHLGALGIEVFEGSSTLKELEFLAGQVIDAEDVCEIGFNAGMSACAMLTVNPKMRLFSIDEGKWECVTPAREYLRKRFDRHYLALGDSRGIGAAWRHSHKFDFTFIDGGHDYETAMADLRNFAPISKRVMMDDIQMPPVRKAWDEAVALGLVTETAEYADIATDVIRRWAVGKGGAK